MTITRAATIATLICTVHLTAASMAIGNEICPQAKSEVLKDSLPCRMKVISWVSVVFQGELLSENKSAYERLIRLRLRNDLSMIKHETLTYGDALTKYEFNLSSIEMKEKGSVSCFIWTVGSDYPVAILVECKLWGYGLYKYTEKFSDRILGYASSSEADSSVRDSIRQLIESISLSFLEQRDLLNQ